MSADRSAATLGERLRDLGVTVKVLTIGDDEIPVLEFGDRATREQAEAIRDAWLDAGLTEKVAFVSGARLAAARYEDVPDAESDG